MRLLRIEVLLTMVRLVEREDAEVEIARGARPLGVAARPGSARLAAPPNWLVPKADFVLREVARAAQVGGPRVDRPVPAAGGEVAEPAGILAMNRLGAAEICVSSSGR